MKERLKGAILSLSFLLPGSSQLLNGDWYKGLALAFAAVAGLAMFLGGSAHVSDLGFMIIAFTWMMNFMDIVNQAFRSISQSLREISESLESITYKLEQLEPILKGIAAQLHEIETKLPLLEERKLLPPPEPLLSLPSPGESISIQPPEEKIKEKNRV